MYTYIFKIVSRALHAETGFFFFGQSELVYDQLPMVIGIFLRTMKKTQKLSLNFVLNQNLLRICARSQCDKRSIPMVLPTAFSLN